MSPTTILTRSEQDTLLVVIRRHGPELVLYEKNVGGEKWSGPSTFTLSCEILGKTRVAGKQPTSFGLQKTHRVYRNRSPSVIRD